MRYSVYSFSTRSFEDFGPGLLQAIDNNSTEVMNFGELVLETDDEIEAFEISDNEFEYGSDTFIWDNKEHIWFN